MRLFARNHSLIHTEELDWPERHTHGRDGQQRASLKLFPH